MYFQKYDFAFTSYHWTYISAHFFKFILCMSILIRSNSGLRDCLSKNICVGTMDISVTGVVLALAAHNQNSVRSFSKDK